MLRSHFSFPFSSSSFSLLFLFPFLSPFPFFHLPFLCAFMSFLLSLRFPSSSLPLFSLLPATPAAPAARTRPAQPPPSLLPSPPPYSGIVIAALALAFSRSPFLSHRSLALLTTYRLFSSPHRYPLCVARSLPFCALTNGMLAERDTGALGYLISTLTEKSLD